jgi:predicted nucleic acid-binding protein
MISEKCPVKPLNIGAQDKGRFIAQRYRFSVCDAMIVATALLAGCDTLYSEDMQSGRRIEKQLRICNPFVI